MSHLVRTRLGITAGREPCPPGPLIAAVISVMCPPHGKNAVMSAIHVSVSASDWIRNWIPAPTHRHFVTRFCENKVIGIGIIRVLVAPNHNALRYASLSSCALTTVASACWRADSLRPGTLMAEENDGLAAAVTDFMLHFPCPARQWHQ